jgi:hypothetical protein
LAPVTAAELAAKALTGDRINSTAKKAIANRKIVFIGGKFHQWAFLIL